MLHETKRNILYLVWRDPGKRQNYCVGILRKLDEGYSFEYGLDYKTAQKEADWCLLEAFPEEKVYTEKELFVSFSSRLPDPRQRGIEKLLKKYGMAQYDGFELLRNGCGRLPIDSYEFIDPIFPEDETVVRRFYIAGVGYNSPCKGVDCKSQIDLAKGDSLELKMEPENAYDMHAVAMYTSGEKIGYIPRYYGEQVSLRLKAGMTYTCEVMEIGKVNDCRNCVFVELTMPKKEDWVK